MTGQYAKLMHSTLGGVFKRNSTFIGFFALSAYALQWVVVKSVNTLWDTHNYKVFLFFIFFLFYFSLFSYLFLIQRSWAYLEQNIEKWNSEEEEDDE